MQEMEKALCEAARHFNLPRDEEPATLPPEAEGMRSAAAMWAKVCLEEFRDDLLRKGMAVSVAIADFLAELEGSINAGK